MHFLENKKPLKVLIFSGLLFFALLFSGETGIRTLGTREGTTVFETAPIDHSGISPSVVKGCKGRFLHRIIKSIVKYYGLTQNEQRYCYVDKEKI